jgi:NADH-quinone oxidoreductase subunit N
MAMNYLELARLTVPELLLVVAALVALGFDLGWRTTRTLGFRRAGVLGIGLVGCVGAWGWLVGVAPEGNLGEGIWVSDALSRWVKAWVLVLAGGGLLLSWRMTFTEHLGEYVAVVLLGTVGMLLIAGSDNVLLMFLALELASLCLYTLVAFDKRNPLANEAALKYFLFGGMAGAFLLFGLSWLYGATGRIDFTGMARVLATQEATPVTWVGLAMVLVGLGFKVALAPFHFWAPDAYQASPAPVAGLIGGASKVAAFFILGKITLVALGPVAGDARWSEWKPGWLPAVAVLAVVSMVWGNLAALRQTNLRRLLAYSAVAHAGYTLVAVVAGGQVGLAAVMFYAATYGLTVVGAFGVVGWVERRSGGAEFRHFTGLGRTAPGMALALSVFVLSLAGIPPLAGFFGKLYLFLSVMDGRSGDLGLIWMVGVAAATTCISFYYYLKVLKVVYLDPAESEKGMGLETPMGGGDGVTLGTVGVLAGLVVLFGCLPSWLLDSLQQALVLVGR